MLRKLLCRLLCCAVLLCLTAVSGFAYSGGFDAGRLGSISLDFSGDEYPVPEGAVALRMVARWDAEACALAWCDGFSDADMTLEQLFDHAAAGKLFDYAEAKGLPAMRLEVGADGTARADELTLGVYLLSQTEPFAGFETMLPALICLPAEINNVWVYDVNARPKLEPLVPETTVPTTEPTPPELPPTGQTNWPVPLLIVAGSFLILLGLCLRKDRRHEA